MGRRVQLNRGANEDLRRVADRFRSAELTLVEDRGEFWLESDRFYAAQSDLEAKGVAVELLARLNQAVCALRGANWNPNEVVLVTLRTWNWSDTQREACRARMHFSLYRALTGRSLARSSGTYDYLAVSVAGYGNNAATCHFCGATFPGFSESSRDELVGEHCVGCAVKWVMQMFVHYVHRTLPSTDWAGDFLQRFDTWLVTSASDDPTPTYLKHALLEEVRNEPGADKTVDESSLRFGLLELD